MRTWTMRIIGILNFFFAAAAFWYLAWMVKLHWGRWPSSATRSDWVIFSLLLAVSVYLVTHLAYFGVGLLKKNEATLLPCLVLFAAESLGEGLSVVILWLMLPPSMGEIIFGLWSVALSPLDIEVLSGYSVVGFVATLTLILTRRPAPKNVSGGGQATETTASG